MGLFIPVQADVADLGSGHQGQDPVDHAKSCTQDRYHGQFLSGNNRSHTGFDGSFHFDLLQRKIPQGLIAHESCDFLDQGPEFICTRSLISQHGDFMLHQRMFDDRYIFHSIIQPFLFICIPGTERSPGIDLPIILSEIQREINYFVSGV